MAKSPLHMMALQYAADGIPIFPCQVGGKKPTTAHGFHDASCDPDQIDRWWSENEYNIGLEPEKAGWAVIDIDNLENWEKLNDETGTTPTYTIETPRGGRHLYFSGSVGASASKLCQGVDTRGRGSYVLVPPSVVNGRPYHILDDRDPAQLPAWISERLGHAERVRATAPAGVGFDKQEILEWAQQEILANLTEHGEPQDGEASDERAYRFINRLVDGQRGKSLSPETLIDLLKDQWAPHFDRDWIEEKVDSALKHRQNPPGCGQVGEPERKYGEAPETIPESTEIRDYPKFRSWPSIKSAYFEPPQWVWQDRLLAFEPNLYTGDAGVGKTTLAENLAVATTCGVPLLGQATRRQPVALLVAEDHYGPVRDNLAAIAHAHSVADHEGLDQIHVLSVKSDRIPGGHILARVSDQGKVEDTAFMREHIAPFLQSFDGEVVWILDPLSEFVAFNNLSDQACRALATNWLSGVCAINGGRVTALVNDHPSKASMASGAHYAGSVQLKAAFSLVATLIGKEWQGTGASKQRKLSFEVKKGRYAAEDSVEFYRTGGPAFTVASGPTHDPKLIAHDVYLHIISRLEKNTPTHRTNHGPHGPHEIATGLNRAEGEITAAMRYCLAHGWLVYQDGFGPGPTPPVLDY